jgi:hypothetical protein
VVKAILPFVLLEMQGKIQLLCCWRCRGKFNFCVAGDAGEIQLLCCWRCGEKFNFCVAGDAGENSTFVLLEMQGKIQLFNLKFFTQAVKFQRPIQKLVWAP